MTGIQIGQMVLSVCQTNCYYLHRVGEKACVVIDPADNGREIYSRLLKDGLQVTGILLTHGHFDHIWGLEELKVLVNEAAAAQGGNPVAVYAAEAERELLADADLNVSRYAQRPCSVSADIWLKDGQIIEIAGIKLQMIATPGHTAGSCCYYAEDEGILFSGDTLFNQSVGRTDFPTGSMGDLVRSVQGKLFLLPEQVKVYPGHGDTTTIGFEKENNPYCV